MRIALFDTNESHDELLEGAAAGFRLGFLKTDPLARTRSLRPWGRRGWGWLLSGASSRIGEPVARPTASKIPPQVPLTTRWGLEGVDRGGSNRHGAAPPAYEGPRDSGRRDSSSGATAAAQAPAHRHEGRRLRDRRDTKRSDWRGGRAGPSRLGDFRRPGSGRGGWPGRRSGTCAANEAKRNAVQRSAVREQRASSSSGRVVRAHARRTSAPATPATGRAAVVMTAGTAGLTELREGWKPEGSRRDSGSMRSTTAWPRAAGTRPTTACRPGLGVHAVRA